VCALCAIDSHWDIWRVLCSIKDRAMDPKFFIPRAFASGDGVPFLKDAVTFLRNKKQAKYSPDLDSRFARALQKHIGFPSHPPHLVLSLRDNKKAAGGEWMRFKENPKRWAPCDEAPAVRCASVRKTPLLEVACDIWNLDWAQGPVGKCCLESE
jgi:hypothetical protein